MSRMGLAALAIGLALAFPADASPADILLGNGKDKIWLTTNGDGWRNLRYFQLQVGGPSASTRYAPDHYWYACGKGAYFRVARSTAVSDQITMVQGEVRTGETQIPFQLQGELDALVDYYSSGSGRPDDARREMLAFFADACSRPANQVPPVLLMTYRSEAGTAGFLQYEDFSVTGPTRRFWIREYRTRLVVKRYLDSTSASVASDKRPRIFEAELAGAKATSATRVEADCARHTARRLASRQYDAEGLLLHASDDPQLNAEPATPGSSIETTLDVVCLID